MAMIEKIGQLQFTLIASLFFVLFTNYIHDNTFADVSKENVYSGLSTTIMFIFLTTSFMAATFVCNITAVDRVWKNEGGIYKRKWIVGMYDLMIHLFNIGVLMYCILYTYGMSICDAFSDYMWIVGCIGTVCLFVVMIVQSIVTSESFISSYGRHETGGHYDIL